MVRWRKTFCLEKHTRKQRNAVRRQRAQDFAHSLGSELMSVLDGSKNLAEMFDLSKHLYLCKLGRCNTRLL